MSLKIEIEAGIKEAMKAKDKERLIALRSIKSMILLAETEKGASSDGLTEEAELGLLMKAAKQRKDSIEIFEKEGRNDLAEKELGELKVIESFLPEQISDEELSKKIKSVIDKVGAETIRDMGKVMGIANKELSGRAESKRIAEEVKRALS